MFFLPKALHSVAETVAPRLVNAAINARVSTILWGNGDTTGLVLSPEKERNAELPINALGLDVLGRIFVVLRAGSDPRVRTMAGCSAQHARIMVTGPILQFAMDDISVQWAKSVPLSVRAIVVQENQLLLSRLCNYADKIICLELRINGCRDNHNHEDWMAGPLSVVFPRIKTLSIGVDYSLSGGNPPVWSFPALSHLTLNFPVGWMQNSCNTARLTSLELVSSRPCFKRVIPADHLRAFREIRQLTISSPFSITISQPIVLPSLVQLTITGSLQWLATCPLSLPNPEQFWLAANISECATMLHRGTLDCPKKPFVSLRILDADGDADSLPWLFRGLALFTKPAPSILLQVHDVSTTRSEHLLTITARLDHGGQPPWMLELLYRSPSLAPTLLPDIFAFESLCVAQALTLRNFILGREESWVPMLRQMNALRTLVLNTSYSPGLIVRRGQWLDICHEPPAVPDSDVRFIELVIAYLEGRDCPLEVFEMKECFHFTASEMKLIRKLVNHVEWDDAGAF
ncbi:hypothetical protein C8R44DRAFT_992870 [Mycena epipterygia]|nr:hypothetical protein C8R44DRAFT_992870 [Mycena epipterygia]